MTGSREARTQNVRAPDRRGGRMQLTPAEREKLEDYRQMMIGLERSSCGSIRSIRCLKSPG